MLPLSLKLARAGLITLIFGVAGVASAAPKPQTVASASRVSRTTRARIFVAPEAPPPEPDHSDPGIFGPLRIGPLVGASFPRPMSLELFFKVKEAVGLGLEYSFTPTLTIDGITAHASAIAGDFRWFVLDSPFFLGAGVGAQSLHAEATISGYSGSADTSKVFITPRLGVLFTFGAGFTVGADAGIEVPIAHNETVVPQIDQLANNDVLVALTRRPLPDVHLVRMGWLF